MTLEVCNIYPLTPTFKKVARFMKRLSQWRSNSHSGNCTWNSLKEDKLFLAIYDQESSLAWPMPFTDNLVTYFFLQLRKVNNLRDMAVRFWLGAKKRSRGFDRVCLRLEPWMRRLLLTVTLKRLAFMCEMAISYWITSISKGLNAIKFWQRIEPSLFSYDLEQI